MASVDSSWISWGVGVFILKPLKWTLSSVLGDSKIPEEEEVLIYVELLQVSVVESFPGTLHLQEKKPGVISCAGKEGSGLSRSSLLLLRCSKAWREMGGVTWRWEVDLDVP